jgi:hypothetical protein
MAYVLAASDPESRDWVTRLRADLALSGVEVRSNSSEFEPGSVEWKYAIEAEIEEAGCFVYFTSTKPSGIYVLSLAAEIASGHNVLFTPVSACDDQYIGALRCILRDISGDKPSRRTSVKYLPGPLWGALLGVTTFSGLLILAILILMLMLAGVFGDSLQETLGHTVIRFTNYTVPGVSRYIQTRPLFDDDFETGTIDNWAGSSIWQVIQEPGENNLVLQGSSDNWEEIFAGETSWRNYAFEARVRIAEYNNPPYGTGFALLFHQTEFEDCDSAFYLWRPSFDYAILAQASQGLAEGCGAFVELDLVPFSLPINEWVTVRVDVFGNTIHSFVENELVASALAPDYIRRGRIGFQIPPGNVVWFDDVRVVGLEVVR